MTNRKKTKEEWLEVINKKLGNRNYTFIFPDIFNVNTEIKVICPIHKEFDKKISGLIRGRGCRSCYTQKETTEQFITKSKKVYGEDRYGYDFVVYNGTNEIVKILCKRHGKIFEQTPNCHLYWEGCKDCASEKRSARMSFPYSEFIEQAPKIHEDKYDYSLVKNNYINATEKVPIICIKHSLIFYQTPHNHLERHGCKTCGYEELAKSQTDTLEDFIRKSRLIHGDKYTYLKSMYINSDTKLEIECPIHKSFWQRPAAHLQGFGCPQCKSNISKGEKEWLNSLNIPEEYRQKVLRVNNKRVNTDAYDPITNTIYEFYGDYWHGNPKNQNPEKLGRNNKPMKEIYNDTISRESYLKSVGFNFIVMWEYDWIQIKKIAKLNSKKNAK